MFNRGWVIAGIMFFAAAIGFPFYWHALGRHAPFPELELPVGEKKCVESAAYMRTDHMRLLHAWRTAVVRDHLFVYTSTDGRRFEMNLHKTCMGCHKSRDRFCTRCHDYNDVSPPCWECHVAPEVTAVGNQKSEISRKEASDDLQKRSTS
ncbi:MAG: sulfate reduction electron transfer complex DsrMKJOP subunit DsrJ [Deltaproteobacteria bacterium]|jgi:hypothetical protein